MPEPQLGPNFFGWVFWQNPSYFWLHFAAFLFLVRISLLDQATPVLKKLGLARLSRLHLVRNFWFCYFLHFDFIFIFLNFRTFLNDHPYLYDVLWIAVLALTEIVARIFFFLLGLITRQPIFIKRMNFLKSKVQRLRPSRKMGRAA